MSLRIFHTSDLHLGMKFSGYPEVQAELIEARFATLKRLVAVANEKSCDLFVVAGDLFNQVKVAKKDVLRAVQALKEFEGKLVAVLPGNHDFKTGMQDDLWSYFKGSGIDNILLLDKDEPYSLHAYDLNAFLYPAPCTKKHSSENAVGWIAGTEKDKSILHHIGVAHGSLAGFSPDFDGKYYPMTEAELHASGLDLWLLGHTHIRFPAAPGASDRIFYPGTPEPDGFDCDHQGAAWLLEIGDDKKIKAEPISCGIYSFIHENIEVNGIVDTNVLKQKYDQDSSKMALLKVKLSGSIPKDDFANIQEVRKVLKERLLYLEWDGDDVSEQITADVINAEFTEGSFPHRLLLELSGTGDRDALQMAYNLIGEVKE
jgi:DNA repair exonuclease SbcCD nuclease subunit